jgi:hypothetical protein
MKSKYTTIFIFAWLPCLLQLVASVTDTWGAGLKRPLSLFMPMLNQG